MIERKPSEAALAAGVNLSPINSPRKRFATDFYGKFNGEPFKTAAENVKFERETRAKTPASPQIKFKPKHKFKPRKKFNQSSRPQGKPNARKFSSLGRFKTGVKFSFKFNQKALK